MRRPTGRPTGRPPIELDAQQFEKLCFLQCTIREVASFFGVNKDTVEAWCKRHYDATFSDCFKRFGDGGKISLRRAQFKLAEKNPGMAIWLGKQYLGQRDVQEVKQTIEQERADPFDQLTVEELRELAKLGTNATGQTGGAD